MHLKSKETYLVTKRDLSIIYTHNLQVQVCKAGGQLPGPLQNIARLGRCENTRMERVAVHQSHDDPQVLARIVPDSPKPLCGAGHCQTREIGRSLCNPHSADRGSCSRRQEAGNDQADRDRYEIWRAKHVSAAPQVLANRQPPLVPGCGRRANMAGGEGLPAPLEQHGNVQPRQRGQRRFAGANKQQQNYAGTRAMHT